MTASNQQAARRLCAGGRDSYLALNGDAFRQDTQPIRALTKSHERRVLLLGGYTEITLVIVEDGGPPADDHELVANRTRMSSRLWKSISSDLERAGILTRTPDGRWMTPTARAELERRNRRSRARLERDTSATQARATRENPEIDNENKSENPPYPDPYPTPDSSTPLPPQVDRSGEIEKLVSNGLGQGGDVSAKARRKVAAKLNLATADPLVRLFEVWLESPNAPTPKNLDALFIAKAPDFWHDAPPEARAACQGSPASQAAPDGPTEAELAACAAAAEKSRKLRERAQAARPKQAAHYVRQE